jgi:hypothetical protein
MLLRVVLGRVHDTITPDEDNHCPRYIHEISNRQPGKLANCRYPDLCRIHRIFVVPSH